MADFKVGDDVRVSEDPKSIGKVVALPRTGIVQVKLNRTQEGVTHIVCYGHELEYV